MSVYHHGLLLTFTVVVPAIVGTIYLNRLSDAGKWIAIFFYVQLVTETAAVISAYQFGNNLMIYNCYAAIGAIVMGCLFHTILKSRFAFAFFLVPLVTIIETMIFGPDRFNSLAFTLFNSLTISACLYTYYRMANLEADESLYYFVGFMMLYALSSTLFFFTFRYIQDSGSTLITNLFWLHSYLNAFTNLSFAFSIWKLSKSYSLAR